MINLFSGLRSQITLLKEKLKKHNPSKNPKVYKEILDALEAAEKRYSAERAKRVEKQKAKEQKATEVAKESAAKVEDGTVSMPKKEFVDEHEKLVKALEPMVEEHKEQGAELKEVKEAAPSISPKCAICGMSFKSQSEYQQHKEDAHGQRDYTPMDPAVKREVVKNVEHKLGPAIIGSEEPTAELHKYSVDEKVEPVRGGKSVGRVMRHDDNNPATLVYVYWDEGPLAEKDHFGGYYNKDLQRHEEPKEINAEGNPPPPDTSIIPKDDKCPCYEDMSVYCPKCKTNKTSDLKSNYDAFLKDLKDEREAHYAQGNQPWVDRLDEKIKALEDSMAGKFGNEKTAVSEPLFQCENCHAPMGPTTPSHLEHGDNDEDIWHCNEKQSAQLEHHDPIGHGMGDLYILPNSPEEAQKIIKFVQDCGRASTWSTANVEGHKWYGKRFIEVPFGMDIEKDMREHFANTPLHTRPVEEIMSSKQANFEGKCDMCKGPVCERCNQCHKCVKITGSLKKECGIFDKLFPEYIGEPRKNPEFKDFMNKGLEQSDLEWEKERSKYTPEESKNPQLHKFYRTSPHGGSRCRLCDQFQEAHEPSQAKQGGAQNAEQLTIMDHTPARANTSADEIGRDSYDEFQDEWAMPAGMDIESKISPEERSAEAQIGKMVKQVLSQKFGLPLKVRVIPSQRPNTWIDVWSPSAPIPNEFRAEVAKSIGATNVLDWNNVNYGNIRENSVSLHVSQWKKVLETMGLLPAIQPSASLKIASIPVTVFNKQWSAIPVSKEGKLGYDISDEKGIKVLHLSPLNGKEMNAEHIKWAAERELVKNYKKATLVERVAMLPEGTKGYVLAQDKAKKRVKLAFLEQNVRAWVPEGKIKIEALESQTVQHLGHSDKVLGQTGSQALLDCIESGPTWVDAQELKEMNRPPATPEALNEQPIEEEAAKDCPDCHGNFAGKENDKCPTCGRFSVKAGVDWKGMHRTDEPMARDKKECPTCHGQGKIEGENRGACPDCGAYPKEEKEALKTALPPVLPNQRGYLDNPPPVEKEADYEGYTNYSTWGLALLLDNDQDLYNKSRQLAEGAVSVDELSAMLRHRYSNLFVEKGEKDKDIKEVNWKEIAQEMFDEAKENKAYEQSMSPQTVIDKLPTMDVEQAKDDLLNQLAKETDPERKKVLEQKYKRLSMNSSLNKVAHIRHENGKWVIYSHDYKKKLGTYDSESAAKKRLAEIEMFKHMKGSKVRPFSKKAEVMTDPYQALTEHITDMRTRMEQVQQRLESSPLPKTADAEIIKDEKGNPELSTVELFEDITMGLDLLESKLKDEPESEELHKNLEELENLLWETEQKAGITPELSDEEKAEPEHKEIVEEVEKESSEKGRKPRSLVHKEYKEELTKEELEEEPVEKEASYDPKWLEKIDCEDCRAVSSGHDRRHYCEKHQPKEASKKEAAVTTQVTDDTTVTTSPASPAAPGATTTTTPEVTPDDKKTSCALCGGMTFNDFDAYQQHMEYTHASDTMPTSPTQKNLPTIAASKKVADTVTPVAPVIQNVQPTDDDNLEIPTQAPTSPLPPGQHWQWNSTVGKYVAMTDPGSLGKTI